MALAEYCSPKLRRRNFSLTRRLKGMARTVPFPLLASPKWIRSFALQPLQASTLAWMHLPLRVSMQMRRNCQRHQVPLVMLGLQMDVLLMWLPLHLLVMNMWMSFWMIKRLPRTRSWSASQPLLRMLRKSWKPLAVNWTGWTWDWSLPQSQQRPRPPWERQPNPNPRPRTPRRPRAESPSRSPSQNARDEVRVLAKSSAQRRQRKPRIRKWRVPRKRTMRLRRWRKRCTLHLGSGMGEHDKFDYRLLPYHSLSSQVYSNHVFFPFTFFSGLQQRMGSQEVAWWQRPWVQGCWVGRKKGAAWHF